MGVRGPSERGRSLICSQELHRGPFASTAGLRSTVLPQARKALTAPMILQIIGAAITVVSTASCDLLSQVEGRLRIYAPSNQQTESECGPGSTIRDLWTSFISIQEMEAANSCVPKTRRVGLEQHPNSLMKSSGDNPITVLPVLF